MSSYTIVKTGNLWFAIHEDLIDENGNLKREVNAVEGMADEHKAIVEGRVWRMERYEELKAANPEMDQVALTLQVFEESLRLGI